MAQVKKRSALDSPTILKNALNYLAANFKDFSDGFSRSFFRRMMDGAMKVSLSDSEFKAVVEEANPKSSVDISLEEILLFLGKCFGSFEAKFNGLFRLVALKASQAFPNAKTQTYLSKLGADVDKTMSRESALKFLCS